MDAVAPAANTMNSAPGGCHCVAYASRVAMEATAATTTIANGAGTSATESAVPMSIAATTTAPAATCIRTRSPMRSVRP